MRVDSFSLTYSLMIMRPGGLDFNSIKMMKLFSLTQTHLNVFLWVIPIMVWLLLYFVFMMAAPKQVAHIKADQKMIAGIQQYLEQNNIEHKVVSPTKIEIKESRKADILLKLSFQGLLSADYKESYELFDDFGYGMTEDMFELYKKRALENRLGRTITDGNQSISDAYVTINFASFIENKKSVNPSTASVKLISGETIPDETITQVQELIAKCSDDLHPENITVINQDNKVMSKTKGNLEDKT